MEPKILVKVSVPLRGLWFLSPYVPCGRCLSAPTRFRPLTGIMVLIIVEQVKRKSGGIVSVPLRGLWFLSILNTTIQLVSFFVSVPLRGLWFLSYKPSSGIPRLRICSFRPLTGIMVLIRTPYKWLHSAIENAFCGADFLFSSFFTFLWKMIFKNRPIADF